MRKGNKNMSNRVNIIEEPLVNRTLIPDNPAHWVVMVTEKGKAPWEFIRGGIVTREVALDWCYNLADDYPNAIEVSAYELSKREYAQRVKKS